MSLRGSKTICARSPGCDLNLPWRLVAPGVFGVERTPTPEERKAPRGGQPHVYMTTTISLAEFIFMTKGQ